MERRDFGQNSVLLGDGGYALTNYMLTPLSNPISPAEKAYQKSQIKTRNTVERAFGVMKRRFPTLHLGFRIRKSTTLICIVACAVLHNIAINLKDSAEDFPTIDTGTDVSAVMAPDAENGRNSSRRNVLINSYFPQN
jgi:DDE superfamily endonuclease